MISLLLACLAMAQPPDAADLAVIERAAAVVPEPRQVEWQRLEFEVFVHFGMNTFTDREWGEGNEDPKLFNPTDLDADQWAAAAEAAGARAMVLVAKHHDGFCLWPSAFTEHSVKNSPLRAGKGDVVREASEACRKHGLKFGVYLSPADLHEPTYGQSEKYNAYFLNQLRELLTNYGPIHEVWFDGATPKDRGQVYDYQAWYALIRQLQPGAVIFGRGPDVRWVGNEAGKGRASEWSVIALPGPVDGCKWPDLTQADLGSIAALRSVADGKFLHWYPAETDTSIRPGWFWHEAENGKVRSLDDLVNVYEASVGNNCVLLLNVPPDRRGRFDENDVARLKEFGAVLRAAYSTNLAAGAAVESTAAADGHAAAAVVDGNPDTFWTTGDWDPAPALTITMPSPKRFNRVVLQEHLRSGQRIERFAIDVWDWARWSASGAGWNQIAEGTTVGAKRIVRFPAVESNRVRVRVLGSRVRPTLAEVGVYLHPERAVPPRIARDRSGNVSLTAADSTARILYTLDGSEPGEGSKPYSGSFALPDGGIVKARVAGGGAIPSAVASATFDVCKANWRVVSVSSEQADADEGAANVIDDDPDTIWHSRYSPETASPPHQIVIDLGQALTLRGYTYLPRHTGPVNGTVVKHEFYVSADGATWERAESGEFANIKNNPTEQRVMFDKPRTARFIKFVALSEVNGRPWGSAAEIGVVTRE
jgi:alpha-L-fucosidase